VVSLPLGYAGMWIFKGSPLKIHISIKFGLIRISSSRYFYQISFTGSKLLAVETPDGHGDENDTRDYG
jgi:hypothetical protein